LVDCDEEDMYPFDAETFVDRIVEDEPPTPFAYRRAKVDWIWEAPVVAGTPRRRFEISHKHAHEESIAGKPYVQPIFFWPEPEQVCEDEALVVGASSGPLTYANDAVKPSSIIAPADPFATRPRLIGAADDYGDDHHAFLRQQEVTRYVGPDYLVRPGKSGLITPGQRASLVDWLSKVHAAAPAASGNTTPLSVEAVVLAVNILDRFLSTSEGEKVVLSGWGEMKIASIACLGLASKYEDTQPATLWGLAVVMTSDNELEHGLRGDNFIGQGGGDDDVRAMRKEIVAMEQRVSSALSYRLTVS